MLGKLPSHFNPNLKFPLNFHVNYRFTYNPNCPGVPIREILPTVVAGVTCCTTLVRSNCSCTYSTRKPNRPRVRLNISRKGNHLSKIAMFVRRSCITTRPICLGRVSGWLHSKLWTTFPRVGGRMRERMSERLERMKSNDT